MTKHHDDDSRTRVDPVMARPRLKEGLVPPDSGIFLKVERGSHAGRVITLSRGGTYLIGREGADIVMDDEKASRKHAEISLPGPDAYFLRDLASTNGTFLDGKRVTERVGLVNGARIRIGDTVLLFAVVEKAVSLSGSA